MQLFHYTSVVNALLIAMGEEGLRPRTVKYGALGEMQSLGQPVVWLTKEESNLLTPEHAAHFDRIGVEHDAIGEPLYGGPVRCVVNVERSRHVMRWTEFMRTTKIGRDVLGAYDFPPGSTLGWWVSLKPIPPNRIFIPLTREQAIEACEWQVEKHQTAGGREQFKQDRDTFAASEPDTLFVFHDRECHVATATDTRQ